MQNTLSGNDKKLYQEKKNGSNTNVDVEEKVSKVHRNEDISMA